MLTVFKNHDEKNKGFRVAIPLYRLTGVLENERNTQIDIARDGLVRSYRVCEPFDEVTETVLRVEAELATELLLKIFSGDNLDAFETRLAKRLTDLLMARFDDTVKDKVDDQVGAYLAKLALEVEAKPPAANAPKTKPPRKPVTA